MCGTCGCGQTGHSHEYHHVHHHHEHGHAHDDENKNETRRIAVELDLLAQNNRYADENRNSFEQNNLFAINMVSSPGSGKTTLLESLIKALNSESDVFVIEGDQQTTLDADRIKAAGAQAIQINTGAMCHLDAHMVAHAAEDLAAKDGYLFIENVGNLVCPAAFDLGEQHRLVMLSVTEGDDKPLKYPDMFVSSDIVVISKIDLLPYVPFDLDKCRAAIYTINPKAQIFELSVTSGQGMDGLVSWLEQQRQSSFAPENGATAA